MGKIFIAPRDTLRTEQGLYVNVFADESAEIEESDEIMPCSTFSGKVEGPFQIPDFAGMESSTRMRAQEKRVKGWSGGKKSLVLPQ